MKSNQLSIFLLIAVSVLIGIFFSINLNADDSTFYFNDSSAESIVLGNTMYWEAAFRKINGSIIYILNKQTGGIVTYGSKNESLWLAEIANNQGYIEARKWSSNGFSYIWSEAEHKLTFEYPASYGQGVSVEVVFSFSTENWFDTQLSLQVSEQNDTVEYVRFPNDLMFQNSEIIEGLYPSMPGLLLKKSYFDQRPDYESSYPGYPGMFADFFWISTVGGSMTVYSIGNIDPLTPLNLGLYYYNSGGNDYTCFSHRFGIWRWQGQSFTSPVVRMRIGQMKTEAAVTYRTDNSLDKYRTLPEKFGGLYEMVVSSPEIKMDASVIKIPFNLYDSLLFPNLPVPSILHFAGFQPGGFDRNTPDIFPPDGRYGTTADFANMVLTAKSRGFLSMPYTNPTWWDGSSPTFLSLPSPLTVKDVAVMTYRGTPLYEIYDRGGGYTVCPWVPFVIDRLDAAMNQIKTEVYSDMVFEDQIGARSWWFDFNDSSPSITSYMDGWIEHTRKYKDNLLATEQGFDRLAESETAFYGSVLYFKMTGEAQRFWGTDTWEPYPLIQLMLRDKVLLYQHDLSDQTMTYTKENLIWNLTFGYQLNYQITNSYKDDYDWLKMVGMFQRDVLSEYADELMKDFEYLDPYLSKTDFQNFTVYTNWDPNTARTVGKHTVSPSGSVVLANDGSVCAGKFAGYNGNALTAGDHYIIEKRNSAYILLEQPLGADTPISVELPSDWKTTDRIYVFTYSNSKKSFVIVPSTLGNGFINFNLVSSMSGENVDLFLITNYR